MQRWRNDLNTLTTVGWAGICVHSPNLREEAGDIHPRGSQARGEDRETQQ